MIQVPCVTEFGGHAENTSLPFQRGGNACCGAQTSRVNSPDGWITRGTATTSGDPTYRTHWFVQLFKSTGFEAGVEQRWSAIKDEFKKVS